MQLLLQHHCGLRLLPSATAGTVLVAGEMRVHARSDRDLEIDETYDIRLEIPTRFPNALPVAFETAGKVERSFHTMPDGSLCLGSPFALRLAMRSEATISAFVDKVLAPYLFGHAATLRGLPLPFGELEHGTAGLETDFREYLRLPADVDVLTIIDLAGRRRRVANQDECYCRSRRPLRACHSPLVNRLRSEFGRKWIRRYASEIRSYSARGTQRTDRCQ